MLTFIFTVPAPVRRFLPELINLVWNGKIIPGKVIAGRLGESHIYQYSLTELGVAFVPGKWTPKTWGNHKRAAIALGMTLRQNGDSEGTLSFDPANGPQSRLVLRIAKARAKRIPSPERAAAGAARLAKARLARLAGQNVAQNAQNPHQNGPLGV